MKKVICFYLIISSSLFGQTAKYSLITYFETNKSELSNRDIEKLSDFLIMHSNCAKKISINGFCDDVGTKESNLILSSERAKNVFQLVKNKYPKEKISVRGNGEISLISNTNIEEQRANNRKVIFEIDCSFVSEIKEAENRIIDSNTVRYKTLSDKLEIGDKVIIKKLQFEGSKTKFVNEEEAIAELEQIVDYLKNNPNTNIEIQGHVCCIKNNNSDAYDKISGKLNLSHTRAKKVFDYIVSKGILAERMSYMGYGRKFPIPNGNEPENKRVEILITKI
ncbi:OmpA family protein [Flavobacterium sp.]|uniref:OmpA family protein n=1 Tax=Flavobacterium sp. TaxID=239 RepID=UPI0026342D7C|nr:OmpA family protein [Flavobacterium sp.]